MTQYWWVKITITSLFYHVAKGIWGLMHFGACNTLNFKMSLIDAIIGNVQKENNGGNWKDLKAILHA